MPKVIIFADRHELPEPAKCLAMLLPALKELGYGTLCMEDCTGLELSDRIEQKTLQLESFRLFPDGALPEAKFRSEKQSRFVKYLEDSFDSYPAEMIKEWHRIIAERSVERDQFVVNLYKEVQKSEISFVGMDLDLRQFSDLDTNSHLCERTKHMFEEVNKCLQRNENLIIFCGLEHVIGSREKGDPGLLYFLSQDSKNNVMPYFITPSSYKAKEFDYALIDASGYNDALHRMLVSSVAGLSEITSAILTEQKRIIVGARREALMRETSMFFVRLPDGAKWKECKSEKLPPELKQHQVCFFRYDDVSRRNSLAERLTEKGFCIKSLQQRGGGEIFPAIFVDLDASVPKLV